MSTMIGSLSGVVTSFPGHDIEIAGVFESMNEGTLEGTFVIEVADDDFESRPVPWDRVEMSKVEIDPEPVHLAYRGKVSPSADAPSAWVRRSKA